MVVIAPHYIERTSAKYRRAIAAMRRLGPPTLRGVQRGDNVLLIDGSNRLSAAMELGLTPKIVLVGEDDVVEHDHDCISLKTPCRAREVVDWLGDAGERVRYGAAVLELDDQHVIRGE
jgi:hypothetical protein